MGRGVAVCVLLTTSRANAGYEGHKYVEPGTGLVLEYNLYVPAQYDATKKYPLLVFLHAAGGTLPRTLSNSGKGWTGSFLDGDDANDYPSFFLVPISQTDASGWGDGRSNAEKFEGRLTIVVLKELLASAQYNLDADRLYVTGPSMGGRGTWDMLEKNPGFFAAGVPCAAPGLDDYAAVVHENIWSINGEKDSTVNDNRSTIEGIRAAGGNPIYTELAGHGHDSWRTIYPSDDFMRWMYAQRRGVPWWNVSEVPKVAEPLTPGQVVVSGPTEPSGGAGGSGGSAGATTGAGGTASGGGGAASTSGGAGVGGTTGASGAGGTTAGGVSTHTPGGGGGSAVTAGTASAPNGEAPSDLQSDSSCALSGAPRRGSLWHVAVALLLGLGLKRRYSASASG